MVEGVHLAFAGQCLHRLFFPGGAVVGDVVDHLGREHEVAAVDPVAVALRLFLEADDALAVDVDRAEAPGRLHRGHGGQLAVFLVEGERGADVDVGDAVAIGEAECFIVLDVLAHALQAAAGQRVGAGVDQRDFPRLGMALVHFHAVLLQVEGDVRGMQEIVGEEFLDDVAAIAAADDEIVDAVRRIAFQDVPQNRLAADFHHGLGFDRGFLTEPRTEPTGENDCFHATSSID